MSAINYGSDAAEIRRLCEQHGTIKHFADDVANRGRAFVTFFDLRAAEHCVCEMNGFRVDGRVISARFARPATRDGHGCTSSMYVRLVQRDRTPLETPPDEAFERAAIYELFSRAGDIRLLKETPHDDEFFLQFFDIRAAADAHKYYNDIPYGTGRLRLDWLRQPQQ